jgi:hypothetical protein
MLVLVLVLVLSSGRRAKSFTARVVLFGDT